MYLYGLNSYLLFYKVYSFSTFWKSVRPFNCSIQLLVYHVGQYEKETSSALQQPCPVSSIKNCLSGAEMKRTKRMETDGKTLVAMIEEKTLLLLGVESCLPRFNELLFQFSKLILAFFPGFKFTISQIMKQDFSRAI